MNVRAVNVNAPVVNPGTNSVAPLKNVAAAFRVAQAIIDRPPGVEGLGVFFGPSGYGKSKASQFIQNRCRALYLEVFHFWTNKTFCEKLLMELGVVRPRGTISNMMDQVLRLLQDEPNRLLIIDEADKLVDKGMIEMVRDIYKGARIPVLLVGEELLPEKLLRYERCHNRVSAFGMAEPSDVDDARVLARLYQPHITVEDDLLAHIVSETNGVATRIVATLNDVAESAKLQQLGEIGVAQYRGQVFVGRAPVRKSR